MSTYHWKDGVGKDRKPTYDKTWRVEDSNEFGTDEYIKMCRKIGCEPYICTNAGTGTPDEMSDWLEYCNLENEGKYAILTGILIFLKIAVHILIGFQFMNIGI